MFGYVVELLVESVEVVVKVIEVLEGVERSELS